MHWIITSLTLFIAFEHLYFAYLEIIAWKTRGPKVFGRRKPGFYEETAAMAINQGVYNLFLVAGLIWACLISDPVWSNYILLFFLSCVSFAGMVGGATVSKRIFFVQAIPALIALALNYFL